MTHRAWLAVFDNADTLVAAARTAREAGWQTPDAYTPHAVHGLEQALGLRPSRLPWVCFAAGLGGALFMMWFQLWTSAVDWRLNVGGRPWNSSLSFACVAFEVMVLAAGLGTVLAFLIVSRLRPGRAEPPVAPGVTDDRYALVLAPLGALVEPDELERLLAPFAPLSLSEMPR